MATESEQRMTDAHKDDIWYTPPSAHYDDDVRYGTPGEMIAENLRLRERVGLLETEAFRLRQSLSWTVEGCKKAVASASLPDLTREICRTAILMAKSDSAAALADNP